MKALGASRDVLPIWKNAADASTTAEMHSLKAPAIYEYIGVTSEELLAEFTAERSLGVAAEILNVALLDGNEKAMTISAEYILRHGAVPPDLVKVCSTILSGGEDPAPLGIESSVKRLRDKLKICPNNPLVWTDLSRAYAVLNEPEKAEKAMLGALHTSSDHRWICRSAARLYVHFNEYGKALRVLQKNPNLRSDPWLLSTELAVSRMAERPLRNWTQAKKILDSNINQLHLSELASSIGTSEIIGGADKKAKSYFKQALILPNGNSLAQVKWADRSFGLGFSRQIHSLLEKTPSAFETRHWECYEDRDMLSAIKNAQRWWEEEPYSSKPPQAISFIASIVNDLNLIYRTTIKALKRNPNDTSLRLNDLYARAGLFGICSGVKGEVTFKDLDYLESVMSGEDKDYAAHAYANAGLINYRIGRPELGKEFYEVAKRYYEKNRRDVSLFLLLNHYREALISDSPWASDIFSQLSQEVKQSKTITTPAAEFYLEKLTELATNEGSWRERFSTPFFIKPHKEQVVTLETPPREVDISGKFWLPERFLRIQSLEELIKIPETPKKRK